MASEDLVAALYAQAAARECRRAYRRTLLRISIWRVAADVLSAAAGDDRRVRDESGSPTPIARVRQQVRFLGERKGHSSHGPMPQEPCG